MYTEAKISGNIPKPQDTSGQIIHDLYMQNEILHTDPNDSRPREVHGEAAEHFPDLSWPHSLSWSHQSTFFLQEAASECISRGSWGHIPIQN
jgi:hypothetical protein